MKSMAIDTWYGHGDVRLNLMRRPRFWNWSPPTRFPKQIAVVAELGVADLVADGPLPVDELARRTGTHAPSLARVLRATASVGVLAEDGTERIALTPLAHYLRTDVPESLRDYVRLQCGDWYWRVYRGLHRQRANRSAGGEPHLRDGRIRLPRSTS